MGLTEKDSQLIEQSLQGLSTIRIAPIDHEFDNGTARVIIDGKGVSTISDKGETQPAAIRIEEVTKKIRDGEWEIREAFNEKGPLSLS